jgi:hypothetical protein
MDLDAFYSEFKAFKNKIETMINEGRPQESRPPADAVSDGTHERLDDMVDRQDAHEDALTSIKSDIEKIKGWIEGKLPGDKPADLPKDSPEQQRTQ